LRTVMRALPLGARGKGCASVTNPGCQNGLIKTKTPVIMDGGFIF